MTDADTVLGPATTGDVGGRVVPLCWPVRSSAA